MLLLFIVAGFFSACSTYGVTGPLTRDFQDWLESNGYATDDFVREDYGTQGSYGGKSASAPNITKVPVILIHGNSDSALQSDAASTGWDNTIAYFEQKGYTTADLYATSWGNNNVLQMTTRTHSCHDTLRLRRFMLAVLAYTGAPKVSFITHSQGVTFGRKIIKGGKITGNDGNCDLGSSLAGKVDVFLGLAGVNYGLCNCQDAATNIYAVCNKKNGFWPGDSCGFNMLCGIHPMTCNNRPTYSAFLMDLNNDLSKEANIVYSAWSYMDDLILYNDYAWGSPTSLIPTSDGKHVYPSYTHMQTKEKTAADQYTMVHDHQLPS